MIGRAEIRVFVGQALVLLGSGIGIFGGLVNALLYHNFAIDLWLYSNGFLFLWAVGFRKGWWNSKLSVDFLIVLYGAYEIFNIYAILVR